MTEKPAPRSGRSRPLSLLLHSTTPPLWLGVVVATVLIAAETIVVYQLRESGPGNAFGAVFLLGVLVVSAGWGLGLSLITTLVSTVVYTYFHLDHTGGVVPNSARDWLAIVVFVPLALL